FANGQERCRHLAIGIGQQQKVIHRASGIFLSTWGLELHGSFRKIGKRDFNSRRQRANRLSVGIELPQLETH
ncbi:MAG: hypothetical protein WBF21_22095, partial [Steroidobacteraceae bacterium]